MGIKDSQRALQLIILVFLTRLFTVLKYWNVCLLYKRQTSVTTHSATWKSFARGHNKKISLMLSGCSCWPFKQEINFINVILQSWKYFMPSCAWYGLSFNRKLPNNLQRKWLSFGYFYTYLSSLSFYFPATILDQAPSSDPELRPSWASQTSEPSTKIKYDHFTPVKTQKCCNGS